MEEGVRHDLFEAGEEHRGWPVVGEDSEMLFLVHTFTVVGDVF